MSTTTHQAATSPVRHRGVVVFLGTRTGLIRDFDSGRQILFRLAEREAVGRERVEVEFDVVADDRNGQTLAVNVQPIGTP
jgi:hypothetical protein